MAKYIQWEESKTAPSKAAQKRQEGGNTNLSPWLKVQCEFSTN